MPIRVVKAQADVNPKVLIRGEIGGDWFGDGTTADDVESQLASLGDVSTIDVLVDSPGGAIWDGVRIANLLKQHKATVNVVIDGLAASAASVIAMAGDTIRMLPGSQMMVHNPWTLAMGDADAFRRSAEMLDSIRDGMVDLYAARTKREPKDIVKLMNAETWMTPAKAISEGFADEQVEADAAERPAASMPAWKAIMAKYKNVPDTLKLKFRFDTPAETRVAAMAASKPEMTDMTPEEIKALEQAAAAQALSTAQAANQARVTGIKAVFSKFPQYEKQGLEMCADPTITVEAASQKLISLLSEGTTPAASVTLRGDVLDARDKFKAGAQNAILARAGQTQLETGNEFNGMALVDLAAHALKLSGHSVVGLTKDGIARKVLASHTSSDFPQLLSSTAGKVLRGSYDLFPQTWRSFCAVGQVSDFKIHPRIQLGSFSDLATIVEGGEYTYGTIGEQYETAQALTKGKAISFTRQMLVNDDLGGFNRRAQMMGDAAARTLNSDVYTYLTSASGLGPTSKDTGTFFNATAVTTAGGHANYTSSGTAMTVASLGVGRVAMQKQKAGNLGTGSVLNITPAVLLCGVGKEDVARTLLASETDPASSNSKVPNIYRNRYQVVADPFIDGVYANSWYLFAAPTSPAAAFEVVFLDGIQAPFVDDQIDFDTDALKFKVRMDYGVAIGDWRGAYRNLGA